MIKNKSTIGCRRALKSSSTIHKRNFEESIKRHKKQKQTLGIRVIKPTNQKIVPAPRDTNEPIRAHEKPSKSLSVEAGSKGLEELVLTYLEECAIIFLQV